MIRFLQRALRRVLFILLLFGLAAPAIAWPKYAVKEGKACSYCHIDPAGGGPRLYRGIYYARHDHSFTGFSDVLIPPPPSLTLTWKEVLPAFATRIGVGDTDGSGRLTLAAIGPATGTGVPTLHLYRWDGAVESLAETATLPTAAGVDELEVGHFAPEGPAVVATPSGYVSFNGKTYEFHAGQPIELSGSTHFATGQDLLMSLSGTGQDITTTAHTVNRTGDTEHWLNNLPEAPSFRAPGMVYSDLRRAGQRRLRRYIGGGRNSPIIQTFGFWTRGGGDSFYRYVSQHEPGGGAGVVAALEENGEPAPAWTSPVLSGPILDLVPGPDLRTGTGTGLYALVGGAAPTDRPTLYYFGSK